MACHNNYHCQNGQTDILTFIAVSFILLVDMKAPRFLRKALAGSIERVLNASYLVYSRHCGSDKPALTREQFMSEVQKVLGDNEA